ncbi:hypothetical protein VPHF99_0042 [Vibrio phage F99]
MGYFRPSKTNNQISYPFGIQSKYSVRSYTINNFTHVPNSKDCSS